MSANDVHVGDTGTDIIVVIEDQDGAVIDISQATVLTITFKKPTAEVVTVTATLATDGKDGQIHYVTLADTLDVSGTWLYQGYVEANGKKWHTDYLTLEVSPNLEE